MKKSAIMIVMSLVLTSFALAQKKGYVALSFGTAIPNGSFASTDINNESGGLAKPGLCFDISFAYKLGKSNLGICAMLSGQNNSIDANAFANELNKETPGIKWTVESKNWNISTIMCGGYGSFPIGSGKVSFETKLMVGLLAVNSPELNAKASVGPYSMLIKQSSASGESIAYLFGAGLKFDVGKKICLLANFDYMAANAQFEDAAISSNQAVNSTTSFSQKISTINLSFGVGLRL